MKKNTLNYLYSINQIGEKDTLQYIGIINLFMGLVKIPEKRLYWSTSPFYKTVIPQVMSRQKYELIIAAFNLVEKSEDDVHNDRICKIREV